MAIDEGLGATVTFDSPNAFTGSIQNIDPPDFDLDLMDTTHLGTTGKFRTKKAVTLADPGQVKITAQYDDTTTIPALGDEAVLTIAFPDGKTYTGSAVVTTVTPPSPGVSELMEITITFSFDGVTGPTENWGT